MLNTFAAEWLPSIEAEMRAVLAGEEAAVAAHYGMMHYHMGWVNARFEPESLPAGKHLRPLLCLMACAEVGGDPPCQRAFARCRRTVDGDDHVRSVLVRHGRC